MNINEIRNQYKKKEEKGSPQTNIDVQAQTPVSMNINNIRT